jgi:hypothetical protein
MKGGRGCSFFMRFISPMAAFQMVSMDSKAVGGAVATVK